MYTTEEAVRLRKSKMDIHHGSSCKAEAREKQARGQAAQKADSVALAQAREKRSGCQDGITVRVDWP